MFYPVERKMTLTKGDTVAARCTMVNDRDRYTITITKYRPLFKTAGFSGRPT